MKQVLFTGDWHCGNVFGLTPPKWASGVYAPLQVQLWEFWMQVAKEPYDAVVLLGDLIDGGIDLVDHVTLDRREQLDMVVEAMGHLKTRKIYVVTGTPGHTNGMAEFERFLQDQDTVMVGRELRLLIEGVRVHARHKMGGSSTAYGVESQLKKEVERQIFVDTRLRGLPQPNLVVRGHVHVYSFVDGADAGGLVVPCLQFPFGSYGTTIGKWQYTMGVVVGEFDGGRFRLTPHLIDLRGVRIDDGTTYREV